MFTYFTNKKASPAPPLGQEKPMSYHRNPPVSRERESKSVPQIAVSSYLLGVSVR